MSTSRSYGRPSVPALYTPVNWHLSADEAAYIVADCGARVLVASGDLEQPPRPPPLGPACEAG